MSHGVALERPDGLAEGSLVAPCHSHCRWTELPEGHPAPPVTKSATETFA